MKIFKSKLVLASLMVLQLISCDKSGKEEITIGKNLFNKNWLFVKDVDSSVEDLFNNKNKAIKWEEVTIPHTASIEPLIIKGDQWQGECFYMKNFNVSKKLAGSHVGLYFEGAMQVAEVYLNGELIGANEGGYLPFYIDLSERIQFGENNCLLIKLNNEDNLNVPPGKALNVLDFNIYSGIYRNVWLLVKDPVHISNPVEVDHLAGGGVFVSCTNVSEQSADVNVKVDVSNDLDLKKKIHITAELLHEEISIVKATSDNVQLDALSSGSLDLSLKVDNPRLWSVDKPHLYTLSVKLFADGNETDAESIKVGIRTIEIASEDGFKINGKSLKLRGTNRHQEYPYVGYAISDNANYRDARKIKEAGFNMVRLSHYPQSQSFLNACDELGILVMDAIPGWQFFGGDVFQKNAYKDIRKMVRVDRNHPSVILWEASLNESQMTTEFMERAHAIVHEEYPGKDVYTCGWINGAYDVFIPARQHAKPPYYWNQCNNTKPLFIAEYGDWEYYAQNAGFNQKAFENLSDEERNSRQLRGDGQKRLAQQALNYQEAHNSNLQGEAIGDANWLMFDYNRGYAPDIEASGIMDIFRLPKFAYYFYKSQNDVDLDNEFYQPVVAIANYYNDPSFLEVKVFSNCDEVELLVNDITYSKQKPDQDVNSTHLNHPPFTFHLSSFIPGKIEAIGYLNGKVVTRDLKLTPEQAYGIKLWIDESGKALQSGCNDLVFAYASIVDTNGTILPLAENTIRFSIKGDGEIIGMNPVNAEAGIATVLLKAGETSGHLQIQASSPGLKNDELVVDVQ
ncbi:glycoside hydrolase family 2 protein [Carboxylicivirga caseinilyticus]|uniref:glycoside hydrolase family 2 protein n=1 Tax=Carboxylicivirga caseinilyticus TaxID=3417572 RepID=UPI003D34EEE9|nr:DUF4982 domain-containing protein [Marinilabiliaceae bacterium A049]